jgi:hypothetical protein
MAPFRYYATHDPMSSAADFYRHGLPEFTVELDEVQEGYRQLMLTRTESVLDQLGQVEDPTQLIKRNRELAAWILPKQGDPLMKLYFCPVKAEPGQQRIDLWAYKLIHPPAW